MYFSCECSTPRRLLLAPLRAVAHVHAVVLEVGRHAERLAAVAAAVLALVDVHVLLERLARAVAAVAPARPRARERLLALARVRLLVALEVHGRAAALAAPL